MNAIQSIQQFFEEYSRPFGELLHEEQRSHRFNAPGVCDDIASQIMTKMQEYAGHRKTLLSVSYATINETAEGFDPYAMVAVQYGDIRFSINVYDNDQMSDGINEAISYGLLPYGWRAE